MVSVVRAGYLFMALDRPADFYTFLNAICLFDEVISASYSSLCTPFSILCHSEMSAFLASGYAIMILIMVVSQQNCSFVPLKIQFSNTKLITKI